MTLPKFSILIVILFLFNACGEDGLPQPDAGPNGITTYQGASLRLSGGVPLLFVVGDDYRRGFQEGVLMRAGIQEMVDQLDIDALVEEHGLAYLRERTRAIEQTLPVVITEKMHGIADGSGIDYEDILLLNTVYFALSECVSAAVKVGDDYIHVKNLDLGIEAELSFLITVEEDEAGRRNMQLFEYGPGTAWVTNGMNDAGISLSSNAMPLFETPPDYTTRLHDVFLRYQILSTCRTLQEVEDLIAAFPAADSRGFVVTSGTQGKAAKFEIVPGEYAKVESSTTSIPMTNVFTIPEMYEHQQHKYYFESGTSDLNGRDVCPRYKRLSELLSETEFMDEKQTLSILRDMTYHYDGKVHVGQFYPHDDPRESTPDDLDIWFVNPYSTILRPATRAASIMNSAEGHMYVATGASFASLRELTRVDIAGEPDFTWNMDNEVIPAAEEQEHHRAANYTDYLTKLIAGELAWPDSLLQYAAADPENPVFHEAYARFQLRYDPEAARQHLADAIEQFPEDLFIFRLHALSLYQKYQETLDPQDLDIVHQALLNLLERIDQMDDPLPGFKLDTYYRLMLTEQAAGRPDELEGWRTLFEQRYQSFDSPNFYPYTALLEAIAGLGK